ncbi:hypothetical protein SH661x_001266 [Planctomicrobium sp. SH661]|uniref:hypothetical protein n=1 Tax=Planctomicrobium sp. SH661 TaxID=3448124 RepID=UPI003F5BB4D2
MWQVLVGLPIGMTLAGVIECLQPQRRIKDWSQLLKVVLPLIGVISWCFWGIIVMNVVLENLFARSV